MNKKLQHINNKTIIYKILHDTFVITILNCLFKVQIENDKMQRESRGSKQHELINLCVSSHPNISRHFNDQKNSSSRSRNSSSSLYIDSQGNSIPLSPISNTSSISDNHSENNKTTALSPAGKFC